MKVRLLQARNPDDPVRQREQTSFLEQLDLKPDELEILDVLEGKATFEAATEGVDAVVIGGSGDYSITDGHFWIPSFIKTLGEIADAGFPSFASCFGFQGMVMALGETFNEMKPPRKSVALTLNCSTRRNTIPSFKVFPTNF